MFNIQIVSSLLLVLVLITHSINVPGEPDELNVFNLKVVTLAHEAVDKYSVKRGSTYSLYSVDYASVQIVSGEMYKLNATIITKGCKKPCKFLHCSFSIVIQSWLPKAKQEDFKELKCSNK